MNLNIETIKVPSEGGEWIERRKNDKDRRHARKDILGADFLYWLRFKAHMPKYIRERSTERSYNKLQEQMKLLANSVVYPFKILIFNYFISLTPDQKKDFIKEVGYDENGPKESSKEMTSEILLRAIFGAVDTEDSFVGMDVAKHVQQQYANGSLKLPESIMVSLLEDHEKEILNRETYILEDIEEYRIKIRDLIEKAIQAGNLPIKLEVAIERLDLVDFEIIDELVASLQEKWGDFNSVTHLIRISTNVPKDKIWPVFVHEIMHALSGQIEIEEIETDPDYDLPEDSFYKHLKVGNRFNGYLSFRWLNEALTENITSSLIQHEGWSYKKEQELLELLIKNGVSKDLLYAAYFENYDTTKPSGEHKLPKTKELFVFTNQKFGQRFLVNLDIFVYNYSIEEAVSQWEKLGDAFPQFLADSLEDYL